MNILEKDFSPVVNSKYKQNGMIRKCWVIYNSTLNYWFISTFLPLIIVLLSILLSTRGGVFQKFQYRI